MFTTYQILLKIIVPRGGETIAIECEKPEADETHVSSASTVPFPTSTIYGLNSFTVSRTVKIDLLIDNGYTLCVYTLPKRAKMAHPRAHLLLSILLWCDRSAPDEQSEQFRALLSNN